MCRATVDARTDVRRIWWPTAEYLDSGDLQDELHVELVDPPGRYGASTEFFRDFQWSRQPIGPSLFWTFTPRPKLRLVRAVAELVAERPTA